MEIIKDLPEVFEEFAEQRRYNRRNPSKTETCRNQSF